MKQIKLPLGLRTVSAFLVYLQVLSLPQVVWAMDSQSSEKPSIPKMPVRESITLPQPANIKVNTVPFVTQTPAPLVFSVNPSDTEFLSVRLFAEELVPIGGKTTPDENRAFADSILAFAKNATPENTAPLTDFLSKYPKSVWRVSLLTNLGNIYRRGGYWFEAFGAWQQAWTLGKNDTDPVHSLIVDRAIGELAELTARAGWNDYLKLLIAEIGGRVLNGPGSHSLYQAKQCLGLMENSPEKSYRCGPIAVRNLLAGVSREKSMAPDLKEPIPDLNGTTLTQLKQFAKEQGLKYQLAFRSPGADVIVPSIVNWKFGHHAALTKNEGNGYLVEDATMADRFVITKKAIDQETSGYFLVPEGSLPTGWRSVNDAEGAAVWGKGPVPPATKATPPPDQNKCGMAGYYVDPSRINLMILDTPLFYTPPHGAPIEFKAAYSQLDQGAIATRNFTNIGPQWNTNWVNFVIDDPTNQATTTYGPAGGVLSYTGYVGTSGSGSYAAQLNTQSTLVRTSGSTFSLLINDGGKRIYGLKDPQSSYVFMTEYDDPAGNKTIYSYDAFFRLKTVTDALGNVSVLNYISDTNTGDGSFYKIKSVVDPFGRIASFHYNPTGQLDQITDIIGITSEFFYDSNNFLNKLTTPYGDTLFALSVNTPSTNDRTIVITDPLQESEMYQFKFYMSSPDGGGIRPDQSINTDVTYQGYRTSYYWDTRAYAKMQNSSNPTASDYSLAKLMHWLHSPDMSQVGDILESEKMPLEDRVYYNYPGQGISIYAGSSNQPSKIGRVLDSGSTQLTQFQYNTIGKVTQSIDPIGRITNYQYDVTGYDLTGVYQSSVNSSGSDCLLIVTSSNHLPISVTDASGNKTVYTYNKYGQVLTVTNAKNEKTTFTYDRNQAGDGNTDGYLKYIDGPAPLSPRTTLGYDSYGRLSDLTDSQGYTVHTEYDSLNRPIGKYYGVVWAGDHSTLTCNSHEEIVYNRLDAEKFRDQNGHWSSQIHDALRHVTQSVDALNRVTNFHWCGCGSLEWMADASGTTQWIRDGQSRVLNKVFADQTTIQYGYSPRSGLLLSTTDANSNGINYIYNVDNTIQSVAYTGVSTPGVSFGYDQKYNQITQMVDGSGTTGYTYYSVGQNGARKLQTESNPLVTGSYSYDELGRVLTRSTGVNKTSTVYDSLGRITSITNPLSSASSFIYNYVAATSRVDNILYPNGNRVQYTYYPNNGDQRLREIQNFAPGSSLISQFDYSYDSIGNIQTLTQSNSTLTIPQEYRFGYDAANQVLSASILTGSNILATGTGTLIQEDHYSYDLSANRVTEQVGSVITTGGFNNVNQLKTRGVGGSMTFRGTVNKSSIISLAGSNTTTSDSSGNWIASNPVVSGSNNISLIAKDAYNPALITSTNISINVTAGNNESFTYDNNGNLTSQSGNSSTARTFEWDAANRLTAINYTGNGNRSEFSYNGIGQRIKIVEKINGVISATSQFVWLHGDTQPTEVRDASNTVINLFYPQGEMKAGVAYYYTRDKLGSIREMTDSSGAIRARYDYDPYGRLTKLSGDLDSSFTYAGYFNHAPSGLYSTLYRFYSPDLGRWISRDPLPDAEMKQGPNLYGYVGNNPLRWIDPLGLYAEVSVNGNNVTITVPITYQGPGATPDVVSKFNQGIESNWSGKIGKYNVTTKVTSPSTSCNDKNKNTIQVPLGDGRAFVNGVGGNTGTWPSSRPAWTAAHETGHLMGLDDHYTDSGGANPGFEHDIMGARDQPATERDITDIINAH